MDSKTERSEILTQVKAHIESAAMLLRSLGSDYEKTAWMVEDTAHYLTEQYEGKRSAIGAGGDLPVRWEDFIDEPLEEKRVSGGRR